MNEDYGFPTGLGSPVVMPSVRNTEFVNPNSPFGGFAQPPEQVALTIGIGVASFVVGVGIQYLICCQASKRCG